MWDNKQQNIMQKIVKEAGIFPQLVVQFLYVIVKLGILLNIKKILKA